MGFQVVLAVKNLAANAGEVTDKGSLGKIPWRRTGQPTPVLFPGESHGQRSLAVYMTSQNHSELKQLGTQTHASKKKIQLMVQENWNKTTFCNTENLNFVKQNVHGHNFQWVSKLLQRDRGLFLEHGKRID